MVVTLLLMVDNSEFLRSHYVTKNKKVNKTLINKIKQI